MTPIRSLALVSIVLATLAACSAPAPTAPAAEVLDASSSTVRVRGTVQSVTDGSMTVETWDGRTVAVPVAATTRFVWVVASSLSTLKDGDFVGTATTGPKTALQSLELVIFPESMRGAGEGHRVVLAEAQARGRQHHARGTCRRGGGGQGGNWQGHVAERDVPEDHGAR